METLGEAGKLAYCLGVRNGEGGVWDFVYLGGGGAWRSAAGESRHGMVTGRCERVMFW
jgi:hypothetical protein